jgi:DNA sulfur modification protein DndB
MPKAKPLTMPSLRGTFGSWVYYTCLMRMGDLAARVHFAREVHESKKLSEYIQRALQGERSRNIAGYLRDNEDRFFNSLVLATYDGSPQWYDIGNLRSSKNSEVLDEMAEGAIDTLGLLTARSRSSRWTASTVWPA